MLMEVSQQDIAERLGVSIATVNRALRDHRGTNPMTRAKVLKTAADMGYRTERRKGERLRLAETIQLGVLLPYNISVNPSAPTSKVFLRMLSGITSEARRQSISLGVDYAPSPDAPLAEAERQPIGLRDGSWRGVIICGALPAASIKELGKSSLAVQMENYLPEANIDCIDHDDDSSCEMLVERLWSLGHRKIAYLGETHPRPRNINRAAGCATAIFKRTGSFDFFNAFNVDGKTPQLESFQNVLAKLKEGVTGWICVHDGLGYQLLSFLQANGARCPEQISVCGFDNFDPPSEGLPKLDSIEAPFEKMGAMAVLRLLAKLKCEAPDALHVMVKASFAPGASTAPFKA